MRVLDTGAFLPRFMFLKVKLLSKVIIAWDQKVVQDHLGC